MRRSAEVLALYKHGAAHGSLQTSPELEPRQPAPTRPHFTPNSALGRNPGRKTPSLNHYSKAPPCCIPAGARPPHIDPVSPPHRTGTAGRSPRARHGGAQRGGDHGTGGVTLGGAGCGHELAWGPGHAGSCAAAPHRAPWAFKAGLGGKKKKKLPKNPTRIFLILACWPNPPRCSRAVPTAEPSPSRSSPKTREQAGAGDARRHLRSPQIPNPEAGASTPAG